MLLVIQIARQLVQKVFAGSTDMFVLASHRAHPTAADTRHQLGVLHQARYSACTRGLPYVRRLAVKT